MTEKTGGAFDALLADIEAVGSETETLAKSLPAEGAEGAEGDAANVAAAAAEAGAEGAGEGGEGGEGEAKDGEGGDELAKSFKVKLEDGTEIDAFDGSALLKSLTDRVEASEATIAGALQGVVKVVTSQTALIKSLQGEIARLGGEGKGRKAVITLHDKPGASDLAKSLGGEGGQGGESEGLSGEDFMLKALDAQKVGKLTGLQVSIAENHINMGQQPPVEIVRAVMGQ